jgi:hypothetical protein
MEIELTLSDALMDFLNRMLEKTDMNHSDLIGWLIAKWMRDQTEGMCAGRRCARPEVKS